MKYQLTQKTVYDINNLIHKNSYIVKNRIPEKILIHLFNGPKTFLPNYPGLKDFSKLLVKRGLVSVKGSTYAITDYGKYVVVAKQFGISFLSLCALSEIYVMQSNFPNSKNGSYPIPRFSEKLEAVYSTTSLRMASDALLKRTGFVCRRSTKKVYIPYPVYLKIKKHDLTLRSLQKWFTETCEKINELVNCDSYIVVNIKKNIF